MWENVDFWKWWHSLLVRVWSAMSYLSLIRHGSITWPLSVDKSMSSTSITHVVNAWIRNLCFSVVTAIVPLNYVLYNAIAAKLLSNNCPVYVNALLYYLDIIKKSLGPWNNLPTSTTPPWPKMLSNGYLVHSLQLLSINCLLVTLNPQPYGAVPAYFSK